MKVRDEKGKERRRKDGKKGEGEGERKSLLKKENLRDVSEKYIEEDDLKLLNDLRYEIDKIDEEIVKLLDERAKIARKIYDLKLKKGIEIFDAVRENEKLQKIEMSVSFFPPKSAKSVFLEIFSGTRSIAKEIKVAFLGPEGSFTGEVSQSIFGSSASYQPVNSIEGVFKLVDEERCEYGVVPLENSRDGLVGETFDMLLEKQVHIVHEVSFPISLAFLSLSPSLEGIKRIYSHPKAIAQCLTWIRRNLGDVEIIYTSSTSEGARLSASDKESGSIASEKSAEIFGLNILAKNIQDFPERTEFIVIKKGLFPYLKRNNLNLNRFSGGSISNSDFTQTRISLSFSVKDEPGALFRALYPFAKNKINMKKIHSRPDKFTKKYNFFVEIEGSFSNRMVLKSISELEKNALFVRIFGEFSFREI